MKKRVLVIGQNGQVSTYLQRVLSQDYDLVVAGRDLIDLSMPGQIRSALESVNADLIINPAAFTAVDLAEQERDLAFVINRDAVKAIAKFCADTNTPLLHFSTDYVFDGQAKQPYKESDPAEPNGVYGQSKLEGELEVLQANTPALILRTSWVYSNHGKNFYKTMLNLATTRNELSVVADQIGAPTYAGSIAEACKQLVEVIFKQGAITPAQIGVYHFTCAGETSWCEFAKQIFSANQNENITVNGITTAEYPTPAARPAYSVLDGQKLRDVFSVSLPDWQVGLQACAQETAKLDTV